MIFFVEDEKLVDLRDDFLEFLAVGFQLMFSIELNVGIGFIELFPVLFIEHQSIGLIDAIEKSHEPHSGILNIIRISLIHLFVLARTALRLMEAL